MLASGKFRLNWGSRTNDLRLSQRHGGHAAASPDPTPPAVQNTLSTRRTCTLQSGAGPAVADVEGTESGPLVAVGHPTDDAKTLLRDNSVVRRYALWSRTNDAQLASPHHVFMVSLRACARNSATRPPHVQTCEGALVPGAGASLPYSP